MVKDNVHFSSKSNYWQTPRWLFSLLNDEFHFELDAAANEDNALCGRFFSEDSNALLQDWSKYKSVWINPPYARLIGKFVKKAYEESLKGINVVLLIPARTDTSWFYNYCSKGEVRFIKGRLKFTNPSFPSYKKDGNFKVSPAPFPSCIVIFNKDIKPSVKWVDFGKVKNNV